MTDKAELAELMNEDSWSAEDAFIRKPSRNPQRAVVSVSISRDDYELITEAAAREGMRISEFMRSAALQKATGSPAMVTATISISGGATYQGVVQTAKSGPVVVKYVNDQSDKLAFTQV